MGLVAVLSAAVLAYFTAPDEKPPPLASAETPAVETPATSTDKTLVTPVGKAPEKSAAPDDGNKLTAPALGKSPATSNGKLAVAKDANEAAAKEASRPDAPGVTVDKVMPGIIPPAFDIVRIAKDRTAIVAGRAPPGSTVQLSLGGKLLAETPANHRGEWVAVIAQPLPGGQAELKLVAILPDGRVLAAESVVAVIIPEAAPDAVAASKVGKPDAAPAKPETPSATKTAGKESQTALAVLLPKSSDAPAILLQKPEPKGGPSANKLSVDTVDYDDKGNVVVSGSAPSGTKVRTYVDNKPVGLSQADQKSSWQLKPKAEVAPGSHTLRVDQVDDKGRVVSRIELPFVRVAASDVLSTTARFRVIVQPGNSLWRIARRVYGSGDRYTIIYQANDNQIRNPDMIFPGQVFNLPTQN
jgi:nucleoid-associated protein YgaU